MKKNKEYLILLKEHLSTVKVNIFFTVLTAIFLFIANINENLCIMFTILYIIVLITSLITNFFIYDELTDKEKDKIDELFEDSNEEDKTNRE